MSSFETTTPGRSRPSRSSSPSAFSAHHRICCSRRRSSDWTSAATVTGLARSVRTISITPRDGCVTGISSSVRHLGSRHVRTCSTINVWNRSCSLGPEPAKKRTLRSAPKAAPIAVKTAMLGWTWLASIRPMCDRWTPTTDASSVSDTPASPRKRLMSSPHCNPMRRIRRAVSRATSVREIVMVVGNQMTHIHELSKRARRPAGEPR